MELTGKCKEDFDKWFVDVGAFSVDTINLTYIPNINWVYEKGLIEFYRRIPNSMRYGVYVDFFDSVGINIEVMYYSSKGMGFIINYPNEDMKVWSEKYLKSRHEARTKAIENANKIYNERTIGN